MADTSPRAEARGSWAERCAEAARAYILRVCGGDVEPLVVVRALEAVAEVTGERGRPAAPQTLARVRETVRHGALAEAERSAARVGQRVRRLARRKRGCAKVPGLLRTRAAGTLSVGEAYNLYAHLDRCLACGHLAGRVDAAEWHFEQALIAQALIEPVPGVSPPEPRGDVRVVRGARDRRPVPVGAGDSAADLLRSPPSSRERSAAGARGPVERGRNGAPPRASAIPAASRRLRYLTAAAVLVVLGAGAITQLPTGRASRPTVLHPISRTLLPAIPINPEPRLVGVPADGLVLGSIASPVPLEATATPRTLGRVGSAVVLGSAPRR